MTAFNTTHGEYAATTPQTITVTNTSPTYSYTTLSDPSAAPGGFTSPASINDRGQVAGYYNNGTARVGFLYSNGTYTTLSDPSAGFDAGHYSRYPSMTGAKSPATTTTAPPT